MADTTAEEKCNLAALAKAAAQQLTTARNFVLWGAARFTENDLFFGHGTDNAHDEAAVLVSSALGFELDVAAEQLDTPLTRDQKLAVTNLLVRRIVERKPAPYLTGEAWFAGLCFSVDQRVLVPRSPIAEWIERGFSPWVEPSCVRRVLDIGTGSGCIAIAAAKVFPQADVVAADISEEALQVARKNVSRHGLEKRVEPVCSNLFAGVSGRFDVIVSNPPYVDSAEIAAMPEEFRHEPMLGLSGGSDGLEFVHAILAQAPSYMNNNAILVVEVGASAPALIEAYPKLPFIWLDLERGGENVFLLEACELAIPGAH